MQVASLDLLEAVQTSVERVRGASEKRGLTIELDVNGKTIATDPVLWTAILNNLLGNAVDHVPTAARVLVEASLHGLSVSNEAPNLEPDHIPTSLNGSGGKQRRAPSEDIRGSVWLSRPRAVND